MRISYMPSWSQCAPRPARMALAVFMALAPMVVAATDPAPGAHEDRAELRITDIHEKLKIASVQEPLWTQVATAMRDNAKTMDKLTQARVDSAKKMTALEDLKSYAEISDAHADGIKHLLPSFTKLYEAMSESQKAEADQLFRGGSEGHGHGHGHDDDPAGRKAAVSK